MSIMFIKSTFYFIKIKKSYISIKAGEGVLSMDSVLLSETKTTPVSVNPVQHPVLYFQVYASSYKTIASDVHFLVSDYLSAFNFFMQSVTSQWD